jgi:hypothetical protein
MKTLTDREGNEIVWDSLLGSRVRLINKPYKSSPLNPNEEGIIIWVEASSQIFKVKWDRDVESLILADLDDFILLKPS